MNWSTTRTCDNHNRSNKLEFLSHFVVDAQLVEETQTQEAAACLPDISQLFNLEILISLSEKKTKV
jgi:hypothetical protein